MLAAQALGLRLDEMLNIYRRQLPVMRQCERDTWYNARGRIVVTASLGPVGVGLPRKPGASEAECSIEHPAGRTSRLKLGWKDIKEFHAGSVVGCPIIDDTQPGGATQRVIEHHAP